MDVPGEDDALVRQLPHEGGRLEVPGLMPEVPRDDRSFRRPMGQEDDRAACGQFDRADPRFAGEEVAVHGLRVAVHEQPLAALPKEPAGSCVFVDEALVVSPVVVVPGADAEPPREGREPIAHPPYLRRQARVRIGEHIEQVARQAADVEVIRVGGRPVEPVFLEMKVRNVQDDHGLWMGRWVMGCLENL